MLPGRRQTTLGHQGVAGDQGGFRRSQKERRAVLWRRRSFGTKSSRGSQFVERILAAVTTLRLQHRDVLEYLTAACAAKIRGAATLAPARANYLNGYRQQTLSAPVVAGNQRRSEVRYLLALLPQAPYSPVACAPAPFPARSLSCAPRHAHCDSHETPGPVRSRRAVKARLLLHPAPGQRAGAS